MKNKLFAFLTLALLLTLNSQLSTLFAQGSAFTYQGRLNDGANPANGTYNLRFALFDALTAGIQVGSLLTSSPNVSNGLFAVSLDFGNQFPGANRWLEIAVRTNGGGGFITLSPRQALTASPYAITAGNVTGVLPAAQLSGTLPDAQLSANVALLNGGLPFSTTIKANGGLRLNDTNLWLRSDNNHGVGWFGSGKPFASYLPDGPVLFGYGGGALGTAQSGSEHIALSWNVAGDVAVSNNLSVAGNATFRNMPGIRYSQSDGGAGTHYNNNFNVTVDSITINVPATGFVLVTASLNTGSAYRAPEDFKLFQGTTELLRTTSNDLNAEHAIFWVIPVSAGPLSLHTVLVRSSDNQGDFGGDYHAHTLTAVYLPVQY
jgi:hypothetical protein